MESAEMFGLRKPLRYPIQMQLLNSISLLVFGNGKIIVFPFAENCSHCDTISIQYALSVIKKVFLHPWYRSSSFQIHHFANFKAVSTAV